jgi:hypothetical protein
MLGSYSRTTEPDVKWFTDEYLDRMDGIDFSLATCPLVQGGDWMPCLMDERDDEHGPECFEGVRIQLCDSTWVLTGEYQTSRTFMALEGKRQ